MDLYCLEMISGSQKGTRYLLPDGAISLGRSPRNTVVLPAEEKCVSGHHAIIYKSSHRLLLQDLQSTNGTFINEEQIQERELQQGDEIGFGKTGPRLRLIQDSNRPTQPDLNPQPILPAVKKNFSL